MEAIGITGCAGLRGPYGGGGRRMPRGVAWASAPRAPHQVHKRRRGVLDALSVQPHRSLNSQANWVGYYHNVRSSIKELKARACIMFDASSNVAGLVPVRGRPRLASGELPRYFSHVTHSPPCSESSLAAALCLASVAFPSPASSRTLCFFPWLGCSPILRSLRSLAMRAVLSSERTVTSTVPDSSDSPPRTQDFQPPSVTL